MLLHDESALLTALRTSLTAVYEPSRSTFALQDPTAAAGKGRGGKAAAREDKVLESRHHTQRLCPWRRMRRQRRLVNTRRRQRRLVNTRVFHRAHAHEHPQARAGLAAGWCRRVQRAPRGSSRPRALLRTLERRRDRIAQHEDRSAHGVGLGGHHHQGGGKRRRGDDATDDDASGGEKSEGEETEEESRCGPKLKPFETLRTLLKSY